MQADAPSPTGAPNARKRTKVQREADLLFIEGLVVKSVPQAVIALKLAEVRPYRISRSQVRDDVAVLKERWEREALDMRSSAVLLALRKLDAVESEAWDGWERSKLATTRTTLTKKSKGAKGDAGAAPAPAPGEDIKSAVSVSSPGDPAFLGKILEAIHARAKLLGIEAPLKHEHGGPDGGPVTVANVALNEADQEALLLRHFQRMQEDAAEEAAKAPTGDE